MTEWLDGYLVGCLTGWVNGWMDGLLDEWVDVWMDDWVSGWCSGTIVFSLVTSPSWVVMCLVLVAIWQEKERCRSCVEPYFVYFVYEVFFWSKLFFVSMLSLFLNNYRYHHHHHHHSHHHHNHYHRTVKAE